MNEDRQRWDQRHAGEHGPEGASLFLQGIFDIGAWSIQPGKALDIATGKGRNALYLAERGFRVEGIDISGVALEEARKRAEAKGLSIAFTEADLEKFEFTDSYDLIVNINFLQRSLIPRLKNALRLGGHIVFETYLIEQRLIGHPKNPAYLLGHNELLGLFSDFRILCYREGKFTENGRESYRAGLMGQKI